MSPPALAGDRPASRLAATATLVLFAAVVAGAGAFAGAASEAGRSAAALACAAVALLGALASRGDARVPFSGGERWLLAVAALCALGALPFPLFLARALAPYAVLSRERALGTDGGVRASLDAGATWRAALVVAGIAMLFRAARAAGARGGATALARALALVLLGHSVVALAHGSYGQRDLLLGGFSVPNPLHAWGTFVNSRAI